jgi:hypothetical protein
MNRFLRLLAMCAALVGAVLFFGRPARTQFIEPRPIIREPTPEYYRPPLLHPPLVVPHNPNPYSQPPADDLPTIPWDNVQIQVPTFVQAGDPFAEGRAAAINAVKQQIARSPRQGLAALIEQEGLRIDDRIALAEQIVAKVEATVDEVADPWQARRLVLEMEERFQKFDQDIAYRIQGYNRKAPEKFANGALSAALARANRRCLDERLPDVAALLLADDIQEARRLVEKVLSELTGAKGGAQKVDAAGFGKGGVLADNVIRLNRELDALSLFDAAFQGAGQERRARLLRLNTSNAPESVARALTDLRELDALRMALAQPGKAPLPAVARIEAVLAAVDRAADGDAAATRLRQDVSARLFLEGRAPEARKVLAGAAAGVESRDHAAALLRDMKAVVLGEGKVSTAAVADALPAVDPRGPAIVRDLAGGGKARDWKPPARESPLPDPGPVPEAERLASKLEDRLEAEVRGARKNDQEQTRSLAREIQNYLRSAPPERIVSPR